MTDRDASDQPQPAQPDAALKRLGRLVGTWQVSGEAHGTVTYAWMEGGFFLIQHVDLGQAKGIEIIGRERGYGATEPSKDIKSRYYGSDGSTLDYVYELEGDTLMIWFGEQGSPAYYQGSFSDDGDTLTGAWVYPGGGGYSTITTRTSSTQEP
jgi:hypothetical protein